MISKELLSEVLNCDVDKYIIVSSSEITQIRIWKKDTEMWDYRGYDIHYLAHKCKEWALVKGYIIKSEPYDYNEDSTFSGGYFYITRVNNMYSCPNCGANKTEVQAVIDACEWILKELKK